MFRNLSKRILVVLAAVLLLTAIAAVSPLGESAPPAETVKTPWTPSDEVALAAENDQLKLYLNSTYAFFSVEQKASGVLWESGIDASDREDLNAQKKVSLRSLITVEYINKNTRNAGSVTAAAGSVAQKGVSYFRIENGFRVLFDFPAAAERFRIPVDITLDGDALHVSVCAAEIEEYGETQITVIKLMEFFGMAEAEDEGYLFVPDGSGALLPLSTTYTGVSAYRQDVYGRDPALTLTQAIGKTETIRMPVFGMQKNGFGYLAIITEGEALSYIQASPAGISSPIASLCCGFYYRRTDETVIADNSSGSRSVTLIADSPSSMERFSVDYHFLQEGSAGYVDMAERYSRYLKQQGMLPAQASASPEYYAEVYAGIRKTKTFLGVSYQTLLPMTTFSQAQDMLEWLAAQNVTDINLRYRGWISGGMEGPVPTKARPESALGGRSGLTDLVAYARQADVELYPDAEFVSISKNRWGWFGFQYGAKSITNVVAKQYTYKKSTFFPDKTTGKNLMSPVKLGEAVDRYLKSYQSWGISGLSAGSLGNTIYSDFNEDRFVDRQNAVYAFSEALNSMAEQYDVLVEGGNAYATTFASVVFGAPIESSHFDIEMTEIPFYSLVYHGTTDLVSQPLNLCENRDKVFLHCIENGVTPSFAFVADDSEELMQTSYTYLHSVDFDEWNRYSTEVYQEYKTLYAELNAQRIIDHQIVTPVLRITTFEDGTRVAVNYGEEDVTLESVTVPAKGYAVL